MRCVSSCHELSVDIWINIMLTGVQWNLIGCYWHNELFADSIYSHFLIRCPLSIAYVCFCRLHACLQKYQSILYQNDNNVGINVIMDGRLFKSILWERFFFIFIFYLKLRKNNSLSLKNKIHLKQPFFGQKENTLVISVVDWLPSRAVIDSLSSVCIS